MSTQTEQTRYQVIIPEKSLKSRHTEQLRAADLAHQPLRRLAVKQPYWGACTITPRSRIEALYSRIVDEKKRGEPNTNLLNRRYCHSTLIGLLP
ncbi:hypothetical protein H6F97_19655 [Microcoleus sp. FACHB-1]|nr:hypothetical protein [Microcoleus sp. FACHB-1]